MSSERAKILPLPRRERAGVRVKAWHTCDVRIQREWPSILPHPTPLPLGEGASTPFSACPAVPEGQPIIAQCFSTGSRPDRGKSRRDDRAVPKPFFRPCGTCRACPLQPSTKVLGYYRSSPRGILQPSRLPPHRSRVQSCVRKSLFPRPPPAWQNIPPHRAGKHRAESPPCYSPASRAGYRHPITTQSPVRALSPDHPRDQWSRPIVIPPLQG